MSGFVHGTRGHEVIDHFPSPEIMDVDPFAPASAGHDNADGCDVGDRRDGDRCDLIFWLRAAIRSSSPEPTLENSQMISNAGPQQHRVRAVLLSGEKPTGVWRSTPVSCWCCTLPVFKSQILNSPVSILLANPADNKCRPSGEIAILTTWCGSSNVSTSLPLLRSQSLISSVPFDELGSPKLVNGAGGGCREIAIKAPSAESANCFSTVRAFMPYGRTVDVGTTKSLRLVWRWTARPVESACERDFAESLRDKLAFGAGDVTVLAIQNTAGPIASTIARRRASAPVFVGSWSKVKFSPPGRQVPTARAAMSRAFRMSRWFCKVLGTRARTWARRRRIGPNCSCWSAA